jgi:glycosyltransferase involved in cell wall biosynthesis
MTVDVEVGAPIPDLLPGPSFAAVQVLVRLHRHPIGMLLVPRSDVDPSSGAMDRRLVAGRIWTELGDAITAHLDQDGLASSVDLTPAGQPHEGLAPCSWQARLGGSRPSATVCIATCGSSMPRLLRTVQSALEQSYDNTQVLVVDNRPGSTALPGPLLDAFPHEDRLSFVAEPRPGLAVVRNRSAREAGTEIVALTDDDVALDPDWLGFLVAGFDRPEVACVTGLILPSQLETRAQLLIEEFGGFSKGFERRRWDLDRHRLDHPLYPYLFGMYGSGANAAWRRSVLLEIGGYDACLGTGTRARGGEDLDIYLSCIQSSHQLVYEPAALVRHEHRRDIDLLRRQVFDYGVGLGAVLTKRFLQRDERAEMVARLPAGLGYLLSPRSPKNAGKTKGFPRSLTLVELAGIAYGPIAYLRSRRER